MTGRRVLGFLVGFAAAFVLLALLAESTHLRPRGPGWLFLLVGVGVLTSRLFDKPRDALEGLEQKTAGIRERWFKFDGRVRMLTVVSVVWGVLSYALQDDYSTDWRWVLYPILAAWAVYLGYRYLVAGQGKPRAVASAEGTQGTTQDREQSTGGPKL